MRILQIHNQYQHPGGEDAVVEAERRLLEERGHTVDQWIMLASAVILMPIMVTGWRVSRTEGAALLAAYATYIGSLTIQL